MKESPLNCPDEIRAKLDEARFYHNQVQDEEKAMAHLIRSLELSERFDNLVVTAQLAYLIGKPDYQQYLDKAKKLDSIRFQNFMKNYWTYDALSI